MAEIRARTLPILILLLALAWCAVLLSTGISFQTPVGSLSGRVLFSSDGFSHHPAVHARVEISGEPGGEQFLARTYTDREGRFTFTELPVGNYQTITASLRGYQAGYLNNWNYRQHQAPKLRVEEGKETRDFIFKLKPRVPELYIYAAQHTFLPEDQLRVSINGFLPSGSYSLSLYQLDLDAYLQSEGEIWGQERTAFTGQTPVHQQERTITNTDEHGDFHHTIILPAQKPGFYVLRGEASKVGHATHFRFLITRLGVVVKQSPEQILVFAANLETGRPIEGAQIRLMQKAVGESKDQHWETAFSGETNVQGLWSQAGKKDYWRVVAQQGEQWAYTYSSTWGEPESVRAYLYTDRPVYRPGHTVHFKGIVRRPVEGGYRPTEPTPVRVEVVDTSDTHIYSSTLTTNRFGSFHGEFTLGDQPPLGHYSLVAYVAGKEQWGGFQVEEYRKPEYQVTVKPDREYFLPNEKVRATVNAEYYFGAPVANAEVEYTVYASSYFHYVPVFENEFEWMGEWEREDSEGYYGHGEVLAEGKAVTDENGEARIVVEVPASKEFQGDRQIGIQAVVTDASRKSISGQGTALVTRGLFDLGMETDRWVYNPGQYIKATCRAMDYESHPVTAQRLAAVITRRAWVKHGNDWRMRTFTVARRNLTTDAEGRAELTFHATTEGSYRIRYQATDQRGNRLEWFHEIWVASEDYEGYLRREQGMELTLDRRLYQVGDMAQVLITSSDLGSPVLLTVEGPRLYHHQLVEMKSPTEMIKLPVAAGYLPNVTISACYIKNKALVTASRTMRVSPRSNFLSVEVQSDRERYRPGEAAVYRITTRNADGKPVSAEVSLGVVDESIYAIAPEQASKIEDFFYGERDNLVQTSYSFSSDYSGGEDKFAGVHVRKYFPDTALWQPEVVTGSDGRAQVTLKMPDSLTTWRATARAVTEGAAVGQQIQKVICTKDLIVRLSLPRFFRQGDRISVAAVVHNYTDRVQQAKVRLTARGLTFKGDRIRDLTIKPNGSLRFDSIALAERAGEAVVTAHALGQRASDAMELTVPVLPHGVQQAVYRTGEVRGKHEVRQVLDLPRDVVPEASELEITLSPSIAATMFKSLDYLVQYPYG